MSLREKIAFSWKKIFGGKEDADMERNREEDTERPLPVFRRTTVNLHNADEREQYIRNCLEQIADAETELHRLEYEYNKVTSHLTDIEELERSPEEMSMEIREVAEKLEVLKETTDIVPQKEKRISDADFERMEKMEKEVEDAIGKMQEAEAYRKLVKNDLRRLNDERHAYEYRRDEMEQEQESDLGAVVIYGAALVIGVVLLFALQKLLRLDVNILCYVVVIALPVALIVRIVLRHEDGKEEITRVEKDVNRLIQRQNTVKIRYVNNKNLLDYLYMKFHVKKSAELSSLWERYREEKEERARLEKASKDYVYYQKEFLKLLRQARIRDTSVWLHQVGAVLRKQEMTQLRQELVGSRKALREQMDYNKQLAAAAQEEVTDISGKYPKYKTEILGLIEEYERKQEEKKRKNTHLS